jgi:hypothetical protein
MRSDRIRLALLDKLRIRSKTGFITVSVGGPAAIDAAVKHLVAAGLVGDYYEFGLYRGYTFCHAQQAFNAAGFIDTRFYGFDSFSGLPDIGGPDQAAAIFISGDYYCSRDEVVRHLTEHGFDWSRGALVEGYFDQSLTEQVKLEHQMRPAALIMVDCDLYQSTVPVLAFLADLLQDGTVILFDDWYCFGEESDKGEPRAFREFLAARPQWTVKWIMDFPTYGRAFSIHRVGTDGKIDEPRLAADRQL